MDEEYLRILLRVIVIVAIRTPERKKYHISHWCQIFYEALLNPNNSLDKWTQIFNMYAIVLATKKLCSDNFFYEALILKYLRSAFKNERGTGTKYR